MKFQESGEWESSGIVKFEDRPLTKTVDGKEQVIRATLSGSWELNGDQLRVKTTQSTITPFRGEAHNYKILELTATKLVLVLDRQKDSATSTWFRVER